jgi:hypothetical protein
MIVRGKVVAILALLFVASSLTLANASRPRTPFYLRAVINNFYVEWWHQTDKQYVIAKIIEEGNVEFTPGEPVGTWTLDVIEIIRAGAKATIAGHLVINFDSGTTIEGTVNVKIPNFASQPPDIDGKFVGHGDLHAECELDVILEGSTSVIILEGYSW